MYSFMDSFDAAFMIRKDLEGIMGVRLDIVMFTDSKQLFDAVKCGRSTTEKRLNIDVAAARHSYQRYEV